MVRPPPSDFRWTPRVKIDIMVRDSSGSTREESHD